MYSKLFKRYSDQLNSQIDKYKSMYIKCCEKINKQRKIIRSLELKIKDQSYRIQYYKKKL